MYKTIKVLAAVAALGCFSLPSLAVEVRGAPSCGQWTKSRSEPHWPQDTHRSWLISFLSGLAAGTQKDILKGTPNELLYTWVDSYCRAHPANDLSDAGMGLSQELAKNIR